MSNSSANSIRNLCRRHIAALDKLDVDASQLEDWAVRLIEENLRNGRLKRFTSGSQGRQSPSLDKYVERVVLYAHQEYTRIHALERGEPAEWDRLREFLRHRAISLIRRFHNERDLSAMALDFAQQACSNIFETHYPCDVPFEAWATRILKNLITAYYTRSPDPLHRRHDSLDGPANPADDAPTFNELIADSSSAAEFEKVENQSLLLDAIDQLHSAAQRQVIIWSFLDELEDAEIAKRLRKSEQAVYNLRQRALKRLRQILTERKIKEKASGRV